MKNLFTLFTLLITIHTFSQETIFIKLNNGNKVVYNISDEYYFIKYNPTNKSKIKTRNIISEFNEIENNTALIRTNKYTGKFAERSALILNEFQDVIIEPVLIYKDNSKAMCNGEVLIKVKNSKIINQLFSNYTFESIQNKFINNQYKVTLKDIATLELINLVNQLQNRDGVEYIAPNFIRFIKSYTNDPLYNSQWSISNQGYLGGNVDADMDVDEAWSISTGSGIKVAIIDEGVDLNHPDLINNLLPGYNATNASELNGAPLEADAHGTACAGIVAAEANNTIGTAGIAYDANIIPVRYAYHSVYGSGQLITTDEWIIDSITWSYQNEADVLSCSWGTPPSTAITSAINDAVNYGRNGKGCVVLFASGNDNTSVAYPANLPNVIAVGASNMFDERKSPDTTYHDECWYVDCSGGSNFGDEIDIVAPGLKIHTTDISGSAGYNTSVDGDYLEDFNGTSSACPQVSGIAALILAKYPFLSQSEVREFIERGAEKIPNYIFDYSTSEHPNGTWNNEVGYGRANAMNSLQDAVLHVNATRRIIGQTQLTPGMQAVYTLTLPYTNATHYTWTIPDGCHLNYCWDIITGQNTLSIHISAGNVGVQNITCRAYNGSTFLDSKSILS